MQIKKAIKKGFTLVELVVVIAVIAILAATSVGVYFGMLESANRSADQQAVTQMNKILLVEDILDDVDSILDVHEVFEKNGLSTENYTALASGYNFYYDKNENKILYVNKDGKVEYPQEEVEKDHKDCEWFSLNLSIDKESVTPDAGGIYSVKTAEEFAYVMEKAGETTNTNTTIVLEKDIDLKGGFVTSANVSTNFTLRSDDPSTPRTIKNITSNKAFFDGVNSFGAETKYCNAGLFAKVAETAHVTIENINFENINVKGNDVSTISLLFGQVNGDVTINNVTISNSSVTGGRNVGAVAGNFYQTKNKACKISGLTLNNVEVNVQHGRSGLIIGMMENSDYQNFTFNMSGVEISNSSMKKVGSYESTTTKPTDIDDYYSSTFDSEVIYIHAKYAGKDSYYPFLSSALVTYRKTTNAAAELGAITSVETPITSLAR